MKQPDETFNELLARLAVDRTENDVEQLAGFGDDALEKHMQDARSDLYDSLDDRRREWN